MMKQFTYNFSTIKSGVKFFASDQTKSIEGVYENKYDITHLSWIPIGCITFYISLEKNLEIKLLL